MYNHMKCIITNIHYSSPFSSNWPLSSGRVTNPNHWIANLLVWTYIVRQLDQYFCDEQLIFLHRYSANCSVYMQQGPSSHSEKAHQRCYSRPDELQFPKTKVIKNPTFCFWNQPNPILSSLRGLPFRTGKIGVTHPSKTIPVSRHERLGQYLRQCCCSTAEYHPTSKNAKY